MHRTVRLRLLAVAAALLALALSACAKKDPRFTYDVNDISTGSSGSPSETDPGSTLATWDLSRADSYKEDDNCTDEELLQKWLAVEGLTEKDLSARGCRQLVLVVLKKGYASIDTTVCYEKSGSKWKSASGLRRMMGHTGSNGISHDRVQGDMTSPAGLWRLGPCFGIKPKPEGLKMPWRDVTHQSDWVGDNDSIYYNTWQERDDPNLADTWDYDEVEHLEDYKGSYDLSCVIRFNMYPYTRRRAGSAIFFHSGNGSTAGCIALPSNDLKNVFLWMDPVKNPYILISGYQQH